MPNENFLTRGRLALVRRLQQNALLLDRIAEPHWFLFGSGLHKRVIIEPSSCPFCAVAPAEQEWDQISNAFVQTPQILQVDFGVVGQDAEPMEDLVAALADVVLEANEDAMELASDGLASVQSSGTVWEARTDKEAAQFIWITTTRVTLLWNRRRPLATT